MLRRILLMSVLLAGAGCHCLRAFDNCHDGDCARERRFGCLKKPCGDKTCDARKAPSKEMPKATAAAEDITRAVNNQDVLLVPKTVYVPFVAQTPVGTARLSGTAAQYVMPIGSTSDDRRELQQMIELVRRLNDRIEQLERNGKPGESAPCTTSASPRPLPRRPALQNSEPLFTCPPTAAPVERIPMVPIKLGFSQ